MLEEREKYIREFFDSLSDEEFVAMLLECGIERTKRASESDYVKTFCLDEKEIRGEKMSYWSFVHGTVTVLPFGRTQAEKRYLLDTVLDHLPKVTGSEGDMNIYCIQKMDILSRVPIQNLENKSRLKHFLQKCRANIFWS